jgi:hypothetical protein
VSSLHNDPERNRERRFLSWVPLPHVGTPHYYTVFTPPRQLGEKVHFTYLKENQNAFYYLELLATKKIKKMIS